MRKGQIQARDQIREPKVVYNRQGKRTVSDNRKVNVRDKDEMEAHFRCWKLAKLKF